MGPICYFHFSHPLTILFLFSGFGFDRSMKRQQTAGIRMDFFPPFFSFFDFFIP